MKKIFTANITDTGQRLDTYLTKNLPDISRSQIKKRILDGDITINGKKPAVHQFLKDNDTIEIHFSQKKESKEIRKEIFYKPTVIKEDKDYVIIEKPAGTLVHLTEKNEKKTVCSWLTKIYPEIAVIGDDKTRPGIVHRLDRDVSGVMVVAKTQNGYNYLKEIFQKREIKKEYWALVYGKLPEPNGEIDLPIGRSKDGKMVAHPKNEGKKLLGSDRHAKTLYWTSEAYKNFSELKIQIITGRTHQIRVHLSALGHPVVGDMLYRPKKDFLHFFSKKIKLIPSPRIMLHARKLEFENMEGKKVVYESTLPKEITAFLEHIK